MKLPWTDRTSAQLGILMDGSGSTVYHETLAQHKNQNHTDHHGIHMISNTLETPYYAVIFTSQLDEEDEAYRTTAERMVELAQKQPGFLGADSARDANGFGITVSYWRDEESIKYWKMNQEHLQAQQRGQEEWYRHYQLIVARVERAYTPESKLKQT